MSPQPRKYKYRPLRKDKPGSTTLSPEPQRFRLPNRLPGEFDDHPRIELTTESQDADVPYEALSYVWGSKKKPVHVQVAKRNGAKDRGYLGVTRNLGLALQYLRYKKLLRTLWVDTICINQDDLRERGQQVATMGDIYRHASRVVEWLRPEAGDSTRAFNYLKFFAGQVAMAFKRIFSTELDLKDCMLLVADLTTLSDGLNCPCNGSLHGRPDRVCP